MSRGPQRTSPYPALKEAGGFLAVAAFFVFLLAACETLDSRLQRNQATLSALPPAHQALIRQGKIQVGFSPTEVYLAWGAPNHKAFTQSTQGNIETWFYTSTQTETYYVEERYYDREYGGWRYYDRPHYRYQEYLLQEAAFTNGTLSSFTVYPSSQPFPNRY